MCCEINIRKRWVFESSAAFIRNLNCKTCVNPLEYCRHQRPCGCHRHSIRMCVVRTWRSGIWGSMYLLAPHHAPGSRPTDNARQLPQSMATRLNSNAFPDFFFFPIFRSRERCALYGSAAADESVSLVRVLRHCCVTTTVAQSILGLRRQILLHSASPECHFEA